MSNQDPGIGDEITVAALDIVKDYGRTLALEWSNYLPMIANSKTGTVTLEVNHTFSKIAR